MKNNLIVSLLSFLLFSTTLLKAEAPMLEFYKNLDWPGFFDRMELDFDICSCELESIQESPIGFKMRYVEPIMGVSISNMPWNIVGLGVKLDKSLTRKQGRSRSGDTAQDDFSFKHANVIIFPVLGWTIGTAQDYVCFERGTFLNMAYFSEVDPSYNSDVMGLMVAAGSPTSRVWFSNPIAEAACIADCAYTTATSSTMNSLYYCNGCNGSVYAADTGYGRGMNIVGSETIAFRIISKMHLYGGLVKTSDVSFAQNPSSVNLRSTRCDARYFPLIVKEQYLVQLPENDMHHMGKMRFHYDFKSKPYDEDDVFFWLWRMRDICVGATQCRSTFTGL